MLSKERTEQGDWPATVSSHPSWPDLENNSTATVVKKRRRYRRNWSDFLSVGLAVVLSLYTAYEVLERSHGYELNWKPDILQAIKNQIDDEHIGTLQAIGPPVSIASEPARVPDACHVQLNAEFAGEVVEWGEKNLKESAAQCCKSCQDKTGCNIWVWCPALAGCGGRKYQECWLKSANMKDIMAIEGFSDPANAWTSGSVFNPTERKALEGSTRSRLEGLRKNKQLPLVYLDITIKGDAVGRMEIALFSDVSPLAAENFRRFVTGEQGIVPAGHDGAGKPYSFREYHQTDGMDDDPLALTQGSTFYRIIDRFICQSGATTESTYGGAFKDDPGGLLLKHDRVGLLSMANTGPDTNTAHFSILMAAAPHLDGKYVIFGEVVAGLHAAHKINALARGKPNNSAGPEEQAIIADSGEILK